MNPRKKSSALLFDFLFLFLNVQFFSLFFRSRPAFDPITLGILPLVLLPFYSYLGTRYFRQTFGQYLFSLERVHKKTHTPIKRPYDWLFESELKTKGREGSGHFLGRFCLLAIFVLGLGIALLLVTSDPITKRWKETIIPLDEAYLKNPSITYLPFSYLLTPIPSSFNGETLLWELPYQKGPPKSFIGRIEIRWSEDLQHRLSFGGPFSFGRNRTPEELLSCLQSYFGCRGDRKELFSRHLKLEADFNEIFETGIYRVENPLLKPKEVPVFLYVRGVSRRDPKRQLEVALVLNSNLAFQAISLEQVYDQKDMVTREKNSAFFRALLSNLRLTEDLSAPRAWVNEKLAGFTPNGKPTLAEITEAQKLLLSKLSVDPSGLEPFYHLFRFSELEYHLSFAEKNLVSTARTRRLMSSLVRYAGDVDEKNPKTREMEQILAQIEKGN